MSRSEEMREKFGSTCKWLDFTYDGHYTECTLNYMRYTTLFDRFEELGFKYPNVAGKLFKVTCCGNTEDMSCFENGKIEGESDGNYDDEDYMSPAEKEAKKIAEEEFKDDNKVRELYIEAKKKYIIDNRKNLEDKLKELVSIENDEMKLFND